jgi:hypothetical protein
MGNGLGTTKQTFLINTEYGSFYHYGDVNNTTEIRRLMREHVEREKELIKSKYWLTAAPGQ